MRKLNYVFKTTIIALIFGMVTGLTMTSCSDDEDDNNLAPVGTIAPPEWLIGTWEGESIFDQCEITENEVTVGLTSFKSLVDFSNAIVQAFGGGSVKMKEIKKTDTEYEIGMETNSFGEKSTDSYYRFKKGDGTYIDLYTYDDETGKWGESERYTKPTEK